METRQVQIRFEGPHKEPWRIYWSGTDELATDERFADLESAGVVARELMSEEEEPEASHAAW